MSGLMSLVMIEMVLTVVGALLYVYRRTLRFEKDTTLIDTETHLVSGQAAIHTPASDLNAILKWMGIAWVVFGFCVILIFLGEEAGLL